MNRTTKPRKRIPASLRLESWPIDRPIPYDRNSRVHSETQLEQLANSIEEFGQTKPIICDEKSSILAGHGTHAAMVRRGRKQILVRVIRGLTDEQKRAYRIADNRIALNSAWDEDLLKLEMTELKGLDFDLDLSGFTMPEIEALTTPVKRVRRERRQRLESEKGKDVRCPKCHENFKVE